MKLFYVKLLQETANPSSTSIAGARLDEELSAVCHKSVLVMLLRRYSVHL